MGNLSEHFSYRDFACRCRQCKADVRVHLGLVGALEAISEHFRKVPRIAEAFRCDAASGGTGAIKKNSHRQGRAAHIYVEGVSLQELFSFVKDLPEIRGIGYYAKENLLHIDTRGLDKDQPKDIWAKEGGKIVPLTSELKSRYGLA